MRAVHLLRKYNPAEWGGTESALQRLLGGLEQHNVRSVVYAPEIETKPSIDPLAAAGFPVKRFRACVPVWGISAAERKQLIAVGGNLMSFDLPPALWTEENVNLIHSHTLGRLGGIAMTVARIRKAPFVITIHGGVFDLPPALKRTLNKPRTKGLEWGKVFGLVFHSHDLLQTADAILTCNTREAELLRERFPRQRIMVQPHGVPVNLWHHDHRLSAWAAFPQLRDRPVVLAVGRIDSVKNQGWLIEQAPKMFARCPDAMLVLAGACTDEEYGKQLNHRIEELGLKSRVLLTGGLPPGDPRLIGLIQQSRLVVLPSVSETFGLAILEAWAAGAPVAASRTTGASALIDHGQNGWLFDLERPESFLDAAEQALREPDVAIARAAAGHAFAASHFDTTVVAGRLRDLYAELIDRKRLAPPSKPAGVCDTLSSVTTTPTR